MSSATLPPASMSRRITKLLIANRGEIAVRIARTAHRLGISTVGVYSEPDANAMHVDAVDVAVALGGSTPAESYLRADAIIEIALAQGCEAIHPGYGFLAENADVAERVAAAGLIWVGPTPEQVRTLGDKVAAKKLAIEAGVPTAPLFEIVDGRIPEGIPMPALVKAAAGGGGRGMRIVRSSEELADAVAAGSREAMSSFGDGTVFVEPYIERARHVEVQIIGDMHGNVVHLGERECSIQRRNQKIVEESPSAGITPETRAAICEGAVQLARAVGYHGAGTVEFLVDEAGSVDSINFLEVNTRLQVEHPVTEAVTGLDLVELQLRVAAGEELTVRQEFVSAHGHAIEVRVVAEDPASGWLPSTGPITAFDLAGVGSSGAGLDEDLVRVDTGFRSGSVVSSDYDSMLAKVIAHGATRAEAAAKLRRALRSSEVTGVRTNLSALVAILGERDYLNAATPTAYLDEHPDVVMSPGPADEDRTALLLAAVFATERTSRITDRVTGFAPSGWRNLRTQGQREVWTVAGSDVSEFVEFTVCLDAADVRLGRWPEPDEEGALPPDERRRLAVRFPSYTSHPVSDTRRDARVAVEIDGVRRVVEVVIDGDVVRTRSTNGALVWQQAPRFVDHDAEVAGGGPVCPLPGTVIAVNVAAGDEVAEGAVLMVVEAMKMEHKITAAAASKVTEVHFEVGSRVDQGDLLVSLEASSDGSADD